MNQLMKVGTRTLVWAADRPLMYNEYEAIRANWAAEFGETGIKLAVFPETRIIESADGQPMLFNFNGDVTPEFVAEFQRWWQEASSD